MNLPFKLRQMLRLHSPGGQGICFYLSIRKESSSLLNLKKQSMPVYVVNAYDIHDPETFKEYPRRVSRLLLKYDARVLAMETNPRALEGTPKTMNAIVEFPSEEAVDSFYNDPEYQSFIHLRHNSNPMLLCLYLNNLKANNNLLQ